MMNQARLYRTNRPVGLFLLWMLGACSATNTAIIDGQPFNVTGNFFGQEKELKFEYNGDTCVGGYLVDRSDVDLSRSEKIREEQILFKCKSGKNYNGKFVVFGAARSTGELQIDLSKTKKIKMPLEIGKPMQSASGPVVKVAEDSLSKSVPERSKPKQKEKPVKAQSNYNDRSKQYSWNTLNQKLIAARMKDPDTVKFKDVFFSDKFGAPATCGSVNAKNIFGAYSGFERFIGLGSTMGPFLESDVSDFNKLWRQICQ